jgi:nicotinate-nucleotide adenylyltransferase
MLALATLEEPRFRVSIEELARAGRSYTIDTLRRLKTGGGSRRRWCFLIGADAFAEIDTWKSARRVLEAIDFVVYPRGGVGCVALRRRLPGWVTRHLVEHTSANPALLRGPGRPGRAHWVPLEVPDVSSTEVRRRAARGGDLSGLVPALVAHYISQYGLYARRKGGAV